MARLLDLDETARTVRVEPGVLLGDLQRALAPHGLFFAPDPTSDQACTVGGAVACNASGPRTLRYGPTRAHVRALTVVTADGSTLEVRRPMVEKNTAGLYPAQDPVDWFVGSEGTLGVVVAAELALLPKPAREIGLAIPFPDEPRALAFVVAARESAAVRPRCLEYFDAESFAIARGEAEASSWAPGAGAMVYSEETTDGGDPPLDEWLALAEPFGAHAGDVRVFEGDAAIREARRLRHAVPATMHERVAPFLKDGGRRVSTDWAVPYRLAAGAVAMARHHAAEAGIAPGIVYGHLGNGHPHQNFVARDPGEVAAMEAVVERTLRDVIAMGGTVSAEHGIGKLKTRWLPLQLAPIQIHVMRAIKRELDPAGLFAPGNIL
jgi:FAD/FMN-containing dehydrogenase